MTTRDSGQRRLLAAHTPLTRRKAVWTVGISVGVGVILLVSILASATYAVALFTGGTLSGGAKIVANSGASGGQAVQFSSGSGTPAPTPSHTPTPTPSPSSSPVATNCTSPVTSSSDPEFSWTASNGYQVGSDAWSGSHGPQTMDVCNYNSWYVDTNQPNDQGQVETYPDTQVDLVAAPYQCTMPNCGPVISSLTSVTSNFGISAPSGTNLGYDAAYDTWIDGLNNGNCEEMMVWNQWENDLNGAPFVATNVSIGGKTWDIWTYGNPGGGNCGYVGFAPTTQEASGTYDLLSLYNWVIANNPAWFDCTSSSACRAGGSNPAELSAVEYGVEVAYTVGSQRFALTNFGLNCAPVSCARGD
jgi:hypothetical protein